MKTRPARIIITEAVITVAPEEKYAAIAPERIGGISWAKAWTEELMPRISPWIFWSADLEIIPDILANDSPLHIANNGAKINSCHQAVAKNIKPTAIPQPIIVKRRICLSEKYLAACLVMTAWVKATQIPI